MSVLSDKLQDVFMNVHNKFVDVNSRIDELFDAKADKEDTYTKTEVDEKLDVKADSADVYDSVYIDGKMSEIEMALGDIMAEVHDTNYRIADLYTNKANKTTIVYITEPIFSFEFETLDNIEIRGKVLTSLSFTFGNDEYADDYTSGLSFDSGETPTAIDYTDSGILNWVGTDCATSNGLSIFQPSPNTHYDIVFYFNGAQFIGLVNGFVPANGNVVSE